MSSTGTWGRFEYYLSFSTRLSYLHREVEHHVGEVLLGEEMVIHFVLLGPVQLGEWFSAAEKLEMQLYRIG